MSFYRTALAAVAAIVLASPVFADDTTSTTTNTTTTTDTQQVATTDQAGTQATDSKINLNKATAKELMGVKGLTKKTAKAIVAYRAKHGDFKAIEDLSSVKSLKKMSPETLKEVEDQLTIE